MIVDFKRRFWISLIITIPILMLSPMIQNLLGYQLNLGFSNYLLFVLSTIIYFYGGWLFLKGLLSELKKKRPGMMTLIAVAVTVAWGYSSATTQRTVPTTQRTLPTTQRSLPTTQRTIPTTQRKIPTRVLIQRCQLFARR